MVKESVKMKNHIFLRVSEVILGLPRWLSGEKKKKKIRLPMQETQVQSLGQEDPLEEEMATHSSILAWRIPWTEESGRLQSMESQRVGLD